MKGVDFKGVRGKQLSLTLTAVACTTLLILAWEKTPLVATLFPHQEHLGILPQDHVENTLEHLNLASPQVDISDAGKVGLQHEQTDEVVSAAPKSSLMGNTGNLNRNEDRRMIPGIKSEHVESTVEHLKFVSAQVDTSDAGEVGQQNGQMDEVVAAAPEGSPVTRNSDDMKENEDLRLRVIPGMKSACNYAKGKWVADDRRPLYSGFGCKRWLSPMWACRLTQRTDFRYESFRWQPEACEMPEFEGSELLKRMRGKTIALVGDSLGRTQFQSLMCMVTGGEERPEVQDVGVEFGLVKAPGALRPDGWAYRFPDTNTTILYYWSASLCELEPLNISNPSTSYAMHLDRPATFLKRYLDRFDVLVLNTGHHWNRGKISGNRWEMYVGGMPLHEQKLAEIANAKNLTIHSVVKWLDSQLPHHSQLKAFFRTISPRHFANGDWNTGGSCDNTTPLLHGNQVSRDSSSDAVVESAVKGTGVKILDITALSQLRDEGHISKYRVRGTTTMQDCLHWCLPGIPDAWNEILFAQL